MGMLPRTRPRGKRYETTLRVGSLANLALVNARVLAAASTALPPAAAHAGNDRWEHGGGGQLRWTASSWR